MKLKIKYFGLLTEVTQCNEEEIEFTEHLFSDLLALLFKKYPRLEEIEFQMAQNHEIVSKTTEVLDREIALLPPFSGG